MADSTGQLQSLKALTATTGALHQVQVDHLRIWGRLAVGHIGTIECHVDTEKKDVNYVILGKGAMTDKKHNFEWLVKAVAALSSSIHDLLGDEWKTTIQHKGKLIFNGPRRKTQEELVNERRKYRAGRNRPAPKR